MKLRKLLAVLIVCAFAASFMTISASAGATLLNGNKNLNIAGEGTTDYVIFLTGAVEEAVMKKITGITITIEPEGPIDQLIGGCYTYASKEILIGTKSNVEFGGISQNKTGIVKEDNTVTLDFKKEIFNDADLYTEEGFAHIVLRSHWGVNYKVMAWDLLDKDGNVLVSGTDAENKEPENAFGGADPEAEALKAIEEAAVAAENAPLEVVFLDKYKNGDEISGAFIGKLNLTEGETYRLDFNVTLNNDDEFIEGLRVRWATKAGYDFCDDAGNNSSEDGSFIPAVFKGLTDGTYNFTVTFTYGDDVDGVDWEVAGSYIGIVGLSGSHGLAVNYVSLIDSEGNVIVEEGEALEAYVAAIDEDEDIDEDADDDYVAQVDADDSGDAGNSAQDASSGQAATNTGAGAGNTATATADKANPNSGVAGMATVAGLAALAVTGIVVSRKRK